MKPKRHREPKPELPLGSSLSVTQIRRNWGKVMKRIISGETISVLRSGKIEAILEPAGISLLPEASPKLGHDQNE